MHLAHGLGAWDWREAADAADSLVAERKRGAVWVTPALLLDGGVVSALRLGDAPRARRFLSTLGASTGRGSDDLRTRLLPAWVDAASRR